MKELIVRKIEELEKLNSLSREFCKLLNREDELERHTDEYEFMDRTRREYTIITLKEILEEFESEGK